MNCKEFVNKSIKFRKKCKETEIRLLKDKLIKKEESETDFSNDKDLFVESLEFDDAEKVEECVEFLDLQG